jgi:hypothetical protein
MAFFQSKRRGLFVGEAGIDYDLNRWYSGTITKVLAGEDGEGVQKRNPKTNEPEFWPKSGDPKLQIEVELQTQYKDGPLDDGTRWVFIDKSGMTRPGSIFFETLQALREANAPMELEIGAKLAVMVTGFEPDKDNPKIQYKRWDVAYKRPEHPKAGAFFDKDAERQQVEPAPQQREPERQPQNRQEGWQPSARQPQVSHQPAPTNESPWESERREQPSNGASRMPWDDEPVAATQSSPFD